MSDAFHAVHGIPYCLHEDSAHPSVNPLHHHVLCITELLQYTANQHHPDLMSWRVLFSLMVALQSTLTWWNPNQSASTARTTEKHCFPSVRGCHSNSSSSSSTAAHVWDTYITWLHSHELLLCYKWGLMPPEYVCAQPALATAWPMRLCSLCPILILTN